jgi:hypothetical protein
MFFRFVDSCFRIFGSWTLLLVACWSVFYVATVVSSNSLWRNATACVWGTRIVNALLKFYNKFIVINIAVALCTYCEALWRLRLKFRGCQSLSNTAVASCRYTGILVSALIFWKLSCEPLYFWFWAVLKASSSVFQRNYNTFWHF